MMRLFNIRRMVAIVVKSSAIVLISVAHCSQIAAADLIQAQDTLSVTGNMTQSQLCEQLTKVRSQLLSIRADLEVNRDILHRLRVLYEVGAVSELNYRQQRQIVDRQIHEQRKLSQRIQRLESQVSQSDCPSKSAREQFVRLPQIQNQSRLTLPRQSIVIPAPVLLLDDGE